MLDGRSLKIAVTGASGFVGRPVCARLSEAGHSVRAIVRAREAPPGLAAGEIVIDCDLENDAVWDTAVAGVDVVVHLAARAHVMNDDPQTADALYQRANVLVTQGLAAAARRAGVQRFVYMSSIKVNGERTGDRPFTAEDLPAPQDAYGRSKLQAEAALHAEAGGTMETVIVRPPLLYGPDVRGNMLRLLRVVDLGVPLPIAGVRNARDILYVATLADLVDVLVRHPVAAGRVFLARDGAAISTPALLEAISKALGRPFRAFPFPLMPMRAGAKLIGASDLLSRLTEDLRIDDAATRCMLDWAPRVSFAEAMATTVRWYRSAAVR